MDIKITVDMNAVFKNQEDHERYGIILDKNDFIIMAENKLKENVREELINTYDFNISVTLS